jgi:hypothetical protein
VLGVISHLLQRHALSMIIVQSIGPRHCIRDGHEKQNLCRVKTEFGVMMRKSSGEIMVIPADKRPGQGMTDNQNIGT